MTYKKKVDSNQANLVKLGRQLGAKIAVTSSAGDGFVDTVWQFHHYGRSFKLETHLVEIKDGSLSPSRRRLTPEQEKFHAVFQCTIIECRADVFELMGCTNPDAK